jgi:hypothetical protein
MHENFVGLVKKQRVCLNVLAVIYEPYTEFAFYLISTNLNTGRQYYRNVYEAGKKGRRLVNLWLWPILHTCKELLDRWLYCMLACNETKHLTWCRRCRLDLSSSQYPSWAGDFLLLQNVHPGSAPTQPCTQRVQTNRNKSRTVYTQKEDCRRMQFIAPRGCRG